MSIIVCELNYALIKDDKVKISPAGRFEGFDGRTYYLNAEAVVKRAKERNIDIVLDINHSFAEAAGWFLIDSLEIRDNSIYATLELNQIGKELVESKKYRYLSPAYIMDSNEVVYIDSVALVNRPNLLNNALNELKYKIVEDFSYMNNEQMQNLLEQKDEEIKKLKKELEELNVLKEKNALLKEQLKVNKVERAIERNLILPSQRDFALSLDDEKLDKFIESNSIVIMDLKNKTQYIEKNSDNNIALVNFLKKLNLDDDCIKKHLN